MRKKYSRNTRCMKHSSQTEYIQNSSGPAQWPGNTLEATIFQGLRTSLTSRPMWAGDTDSQGPPQALPASPAQSGPAPGQHNINNLCLTSCVTQLFLLLYLPLQQTLRNFLQAFVCYAAVASKSRLSRHPPCSGRVTWSYCQFQPPLHSDLQ